MIVEAFASHGDGAAVRLTEAANYRELAVSLDDIDRQRLPDALAASGAGHFDGTHVWLSIRWLHDGVRSSGQGQQAPPQFDDMIQYARAQGWVSTDGEYVRAHVLGGNG